MNTNGESINIVSVEDSQEYENPWAQQAREWSDHCACERRDRELNPGMERSYNRLGWNHHGSGRW